MATFTIRNLSEKIVRSLKAFARKNRRSLHQEVHELLTEHVAERISVLNQIKAAWNKQARRPTAAEIEGWIAKGRQ